MSTTITRIGPADNGRRMSLKEFELAEVQEGHLYELSRGVVTVSDVPNRLHLLVVAAIKGALSAYMALFPDRLRFVNAGSECKLLIGDLESERHPDLSLYLTPPPEIDNEGLWHVWLPEIVIEVVSVSSRKRDYGEKPEEYFRIGVKEYWIVDAQKRVMVVMRRSRGRWSEKTIAPGATYRSPLLPGFELSIQKVFQAAGLA